jgi:hypothetical protein
VPEYLGHLPGAVLELVVQVDRRVDQRQVAEGLREVAELLAGAVLGPIPRDQVQASFMNPIPAVRIPVG